MSLPWPFSRQGARPSTQADFEPLQPLDPEQFENNAVSISLNLTDKLVEAIDFLSVENDNSRQDVLRAILFEHVYGAAALIQLIKWREEQADADSMVRVVAVGQGVKFSTRRNSDYETMGKASKDFKLHLPEILRTDLESLARPSGLKLADYCRRVLVLNLFGARHATRWQSPDVG